jgi:hypothetical protein
MGLRGLFEAIHAGVMTQFANGGDKGSCEPGIVFDFEKALYISAIALQNAQIARKLKDPEIHFEVNSHAFLL